MHKGAIHASVVGINPCYRIYITEEVPKLEGDEAKDAHKRSMAKDKRIIADSIKDHLIPHVSVFKTLKEVYDALTKRFEWKNIN